MNFFKTLVLILLFCSISPQFLYSSKEIQSTSCTEAYEQFVEESYREVKKELCEGDPFIAAFSIKKYFSTRGRDVQYEYKAYDNLGFNYETKSGSLPIFPYQDIYISPYDCYGDCPYRIEITFRVYNTTTNFLEFECTEEISGTFEQRPDGDLYWETEDFEPAVISTEEYCGDPSSGIQVCGKCGEAEEVTVKVRPNISLSVNQLNIGYILSTSTIDETKSYGSTITIPISSQPEREYYLNNLSSIQSMFTFDKTVPLTGSGTACKFIGLSLNKRFYISFEKKYKCEENDILTGRNQKFRAPNSVGIIYCETSDTCPSSSLEVSTDVSYTRACKVNIDPNYSENDCDPLQFAWTFPNGTTSDRAEVVGGPFGVYQLIVSNKNCDEKRYTINTICDNAGLSIEEVGDQYCKIAKCKVGGGRTCETTVGCGDTYGKNCAIIPNGDDFFCTEERWVDIQEDGTSYLVSEKYLAANVSILESGGTCIKTVTCPTCESNVAPIVIRSPVFIDYEQEDFGPRCIEVKYCFGDEYSRIPELPEITYGTEIDPFASLDCSGVYECGEQEYYNTSGASVQLEYEGDAAAVICKYTFYCGGEKMQVPNGEGGGYEVHLGAEAKDTGGGTCYWVCNDFGKNKNTSIVTSCSGGVPPNCNITNLKVSSPISCKSSFSTECIVVSFDYAGPANENVEFFLGEDSSNGAILQTSTFPNVKTGANSYNLCLDYRQKCYLEEINYNLELVIGNQLCGSFLTYSVPLCCAGGGTSCTINSISKTWKEERCNNGVAEERFRFTASGSASSYTFTISGGLSDVVTTSSNYIDYWFPNGAYNVSVSSTCTSTTKSTGTFNAYNSSNCSGGGTGGGSGNCTITSISKTWRQERCNNGVAEEEFQFTVNGTASTYDYHISGGMNYTLSNQPASINIWFPNGSYTVTAAASCANAGKSTGWFSTYNGSNCSGGGTGGGSGSCTISGVSKTWLSNYCEGGLPGQLFTFNVSGTATACTYTVGGDDSYSFTGSSSEDIWFPNGNYHVTVSATCSSTSKSTGWFGISYNGGCTSKTNSKSSRVQVRNNPVQVNETMYIDLHDFDLENNQVTYQIYDIIGNLIVADNLAIEGRINTIDFKSTKSGIYIVRIFEPATKRQTVRKFLVME